MNRTEDSNTTSKLSGKFSLRALSVLAYANSFTQWHYRHAGELQDVMAPDFFANAAELIGDHDRISLTANDGAAEAVCLREGEAVQIVLICIVGLPTRRAAA